MGLVSGSQSKSRHISNMVHSGVLCDTPQNDDVLALGDIAALLKLEGHWSSLPRGRGGDGSHVVA